MIVVSVRQGRGVSVPVVRVFANVIPWHREYRSVITFANVIPWHREYRSVITFDLSDRLRVIRRREDIR